MYKLGSIGLHDDDLLYGLGTESSYPFKVFGVGATSVKNVFKVKFTQAVSTIPQLLAFDNNTTTFYLTGDLFSSDFDIFSGTNETENKPLLKIVDTTRDTPSNAWYTEATIKENCATCMMHGLSSYIKFRYSLSSMVAGASMTWNSLIEVPWDLTYSSTTRHDLAIRYAYNGTIPNVTFYANNETLNGNDITPVWTDIDSSMVGILFGDENSTLDKVTMKVPSSGSTMTKTAWVVMDY